MIIVISRDLAIVGIGERARRDMELGIGRKERDLRLLEPITLLRRIRSSEIHMKDWLAAGYSIGYALSYIISSVFHQVKSSKEMCRL